MTVDAGTVLIHEGQLNRHAYFIGSGSVAIDVDGERVATVAAGSIVGERTAIERGPANATVTATERTKVFAVDHRRSSVPRPATPPSGPSSDELADERTNVAA